MKRILAVLFVIGLAGCAQPVVTPESRNTATGEIVPARTNYVANPAASQIGEIAKGVAPLVPAPIGEIVGAFGILIGAVAGGIAKYKNTQANLHQSTIRAVASGIEQSLPGITQAINATIPAAGGSEKAMATAQTVLSAVKASIEASTHANGTAANLDNQLAAIGTGPKA